MDSRNDASRPLQVWLLRKPADFVKRFREYDIAVYLESRGFLVTPRFLYVTTISLSHLVPPICVNCRQCRIQNLEQDRLSVAVSSLVSLKVSRPGTAAIARSGALLAQRTAGMVRSGYAAARSIPLRGGSRK
jgi:hypothetical protein